MSFIAAARLRERLQATEEDAMPDITHGRIDEIEAVDFLEGFTFRQAGRELGVTPFGMSIIDMPPNTAAYPAHDHHSEGPGTRRPTSSGKRRSTSRCGDQRTSRSTASGIPWTPITSSGSGRPRGARSCRGQKASGCWRSAACRARRTILHAWVEDAGRCAAQ
jgi:hypothetical protein